MKNYVAEHTCEKVWEVKQMMYTYLAKRYVEEFRNNENVSPKSFANIVLKELNMVLKMFKFGRQNTRLLRWSMEMKRSNIACCGTLEKNWDSEIILMVYI